MMNSPHRFRRDQQAGMSLIEVLVSILIFSFGIVGLIGLQARALQYSSSAEDTARAALLANEIATAIVLGQTTPRTQLVPAAAYATWQARVALPPADGGLPSGVGTVTALTANTANIEITWRPPQAAATAAANKYVTQVTVP